MTSGVTVTKKGSPPEVRLNALLDFLVAQAIGIIQRRTAKGIDMHGRAFDGYSDLYAMQLRAVGESDAVDLTRSGAYLAGISERSRTVDVASMTASAAIGPGTGTSPPRPLPPPWVFDPKKTPAQRAEAFADWKASSKKMKPSPPHNVLAKYLSVKFKHLGISQDEMKKLAAEAARIALAKK